MQNKLSTNQRATNPIASVIYEIIFKYLYLHQPTTQPTCIFVMVILLIWYFHRAYYFNTGLMSPNQEYIFIIECNKI